MLKARHGVLLALASLLVACEDEGNPGDDSLLTGGSLVFVGLVVLIVVVAFLLLKRNH